MKLVQNVLIFLLLLLGAAIIYFHQDIIDYYNEHYGEKDNRPVIASISKYSGKVRYKLPKRLVYKNAKENTELRYWDTIQTDENSTALIKFSNGLEIEVAANSLIVLEEPEVGADGQILLSFLRGDFKILKGKAGKVAIRKKKKRVFDPFGKNILNPLIVKKAPEPEKEPEIEPEPMKIVTPPKKVTQKAKNIKKDIKSKNMVRRVPKETLSDEYISSVVTKQRPFFNRCFVQHLRLNPNASGIVDFSFKILPSGKVNKIKILRSTIKDPRFQQCTLSVVQRAKFKSFKGDPIVVNYPVNFE